MSEILLCAQGGNANGFSALLTALGHRATVAGTLALMEKGLGADLCLVIVDLDSLADQANAWWEKVVQRIDRHQILLVASSARPKEVGELFLRYRMTNLLARNGEIHQRDFGSTVTKILGGNIFGVAPYLAENTTVVERTIRGSADKDGCVDAVCAYATLAKVPRRLVDQLATITDEMVTNAVYNAPRGPGGQPRYANWKRTQVVVLEPHEVAQLSFGADSSRFIISVSDPFGRLTPDRVLDYLTRCHQKGEDQIDVKEGGAGLGLYLMFNSVSHFVVNIAPGTRTELIGIIDTSQNYREFAKRAKSFNLFLQRGEDAPPAPS